MGDVQQILLKEEALAWAAYKELGDSGSKDKQKMLKRGDTAGLATRGCDSTPQPGHHMLMDTRSSNASVEE